MLVSPMMAWFLKDKYSFHDRPLLHPTQALKCRPGVLLGWHIGFTAGLLRLRVAVRMWRVRVLTWWIWGAFWALEGSWTIVFLNQFSNFYCFITISFVVLLGPRSSFGFSAVFVRFCYEPLPSYFKNGILLQRVKTKDCLKMWNKFFRRWMHT